MADSRRIRDGLKFVDRVVKNVGVLGRFTMAGVPGSKRKLTVRTRELSQVHGGLLFEFFNPL